MNKSILLCAALLLALCACQGRTAAPTAQPSTPLQPGLTPPPAAEPLPPDPQAVSFQASDGQALSGWYYPARVNPGPLVVLMHWAGADMYDWIEIAAWLQNRGLENPFGIPGDGPWWDPAWFPPVGGGVSYGVFIFTFRGCTAVGCAEFVPTGWMLDAQAALRTATGLAGVDPGQVALIGSSIGADGAADTCAWLDTLLPGSCRGALSLSPGGYLGEEYPFAVRSLGEQDPPVPAWCLANETEFPECEAAEEADNPAYQDFRVPGGGHGNELLSPGLDPLPMQILLDFLAATLGS